MKREPYVDFLAERNNLIQRLHEQGIHVRHGRLFGTQMGVPSRNGIKWEGFSSERARELLSELEGPSKIDIANARMRP